MQIIFQGIRVYGVQCDASNDERTNIFYQTLADKTAGRRVELQQFSNLFDFIMAICYREQGAEFLDMYEMEVRARDARMGLHSDVSAMFGALKDGEPSASSSADKGDMPKSRTVPYKPTRKKKPSLTKAASLTNLKEKSVSVFKAAKSISKRKMSSAVDRKRIKLLAISYQKVKLFNGQFHIYISLV